MLTPYDNPKSNSQSQVQKEGIFIPRSALLIALSLSVVSAAVIIASMGLRGIIDPGPEPMAPRAAPTAPATPTADTGDQIDQSETSQSNGFLFIWLFFMLALGCAGGSFVVTQFLMRASFPVQGKRRRTRRKRLKGRKKAVPLPPSNTVPMPQAATMAANMRRNPQPQPQPVVTVLSPQERTHLDRNREKDNLVDMMDMRKRHSLSALMRDR